MQSTTIADSTDTNDTHLDDTTSHSKQYQSSDQGQPSDHYQPTLGINGEKPVRPFLDRFIESARPPWDALPEELRPPKEFDHVYRRILESERHSYHASSIDVLVMRDAAGGQVGHPFVRHHFPGKNERSSLFFVYFQGSKPVPYQMPCIEAGPEELDTELAPGTELHAAIGAFLANISPDLQGSPIPVDMIPDPAYQASLAGMKPIDSRLILPDNPILAAHAVQWARTEAIAYKAFHAYRKFFPSEDGARLVQERLAITPNPAHKAVGIIGYDDSSMGFAIRPRRLAAEADLVFHRYYIDDQLQRLLDRDRFENPTRYGLKPDQKPPNPATESEKKLKEIELSGGCVLRTSEPVGR